MPELRLFDEPDYKRAPRVEKIYMHLMEPKRYRLTSNEELYRRKLVRAFTIISEYTANHVKAVKLLMELETCNRFTAMELIKDAEELFGMLRKINKEMQVTLLYDKAIRGMERAESMGDDEGARRWMNIAIKVAALDKTDEESVDYSDLQLPATIEYTDDTSALLDDAEIDEDEEE